LLVGPYKKRRHTVGTSVLLAASPLLDGIGGRYFENCNEALPHDPTTAGESMETGGVAAHALDPDAAARLWDVSVDMLTG
jgi:hypothetical protein